METRVAVVAVIVQEGAGGDGAERSAAPVWKAYHWPDGRTLSHKESQHHQRGYGRAGRCGLGALRQAGAAPRRDPKTVYARRRRCKKRFRPPFSGPRASPAAAQTLAALPLGTVPQNTEKRSAVREPHDRVAVPGGRQPAGVLRLALHSPSPLPLSCSFCPWPPAAGSRTFRIRPPQPRRAMRRGWFPPILRRSSPRKPSRPGSPP